MIGKHCVLILMLSLPRTQKEMSRCLDMNIQFCCHEHAGNFTSILSNLLAFWATDTTGRFPSVSSKISGFVNMNTAWKNVPRSLQRYLINCQKRDSKIAWLLGKKAVLSSQIKLEIIQTSHQKYPQCPYISQSRLRSTSCERDMKFIVETSIWNVKRRLFLQATLL